MNIKSALSKYTLQDWIFIVFSLFWVIVVVTDYLNKQVVYIPSVTHFKYIRLFSFFGILGTFLSLYYNRVGPFKKWKPLPINGIVIFLIVMIAICSITLAYNKYWKAPLDISNYMHLWGKGVFTMGLSYLLVVSVYSMGNFVRSKLILEKKLDLTFGLLDICIGFAIYTLVMMGLGALAVLDQFVVIGILVLFGLINYKSSFEFIKSTLWTPINRPKDLNVWGGLLAFFIVIYISMNYFYTQAPYPLGFDARNFYVNISKLIGEAGALIPGFQPYAWGLVMSTGYIAFDSPEITMFISVLGGILSLLAIYHFCKRYINLSSNMSFLVVLLYLLTPTVTNHFIIEFKVDLTLLFFQFVILNFLMWWMFESKPDDERGSLLESKRDYYAIGIIGMLLGYCLSIKVLSVFLIIGIFLGLWWYQKDKWGVLGLAAMFIGIILIAGLDSLSGLRDYHKSPTYTGIILVSIGLLSMIYSFFKSREKFISSSKLLGICGIVCLLTFSPWIYKNYTFTKSTSIIKLIMGDKPRPDVKLRRSK